MKCGGEGDQNLPRKSSKDWKPWCADIAPPSSWPGEADHSVPRLA